MVLSDRTVFGLEFRLRVFSVEIETMTQSDATVSLSAEGLHLLLAVNV